MSNPSVNGDADGWSWFSFCRRFVIAAWSPLVCLAFLAAGTGTGTGTGAGTGAGAGAYAGAGRVLGEHSADAARAGRAVEVLQRWYNPTNGLWETTSWWNSANALTAIIDYSKRTGSEEYWPVIVNTFDRCKEFEVFSSKLGRNKLIRNFINPWYDDEGWWVLVWIDAYDLTGEARYLEMAKTIFEDMTTGWDDVCGGGVYWKKPKIGKHAITNELFLLGAIRLHQRSPGMVRGRSFLQWAIATWRWLEDVQMVNGDYLVENGLSGECELQRGSFYTYNQGVILGGLLELGTSTGDFALIELARKIATAAIGRLSYTNGVLKEASEPKMTGDNIQFKGIFMRNLSQLYTVTADPVFGQFIRRNADSIWTKARDIETDELGAVWVGPFDQGDAARQSSALDGLNAALCLGTEHPSPGTDSSRASAPKSTRVMTWHIDDDGVASNLNTHVSTVRQRLRTHSPDVVALQGLAGWTAERLAKEAAAWGHPHTVFFNGSRSPVALTSSRPIVIREKLSKELSHGLIHCRTFGLEFFTFELSADDLELRRKEAEQIVFRIDLLRRSGREVIVLGNFNALSPFDAPLYRQTKRADHPGATLSESPDYSVMSRFLGASLVDLCQRDVSALKDRVTSGLFSVQERQPSAGALSRGVTSMYRRSRTDYVLATPNLARRATRCRVIRGSRNRSESGHFPVVFELAL